jgi:dolichol kinase
VSRAPVIGAAARLTLRREVARKALHLVFVVVPVAYALGFPRTWLLMALGAGALVAVVVELARAWHAPTRARFVRWVGALLREHEHARWSGATWMILSMLAVVALAPRGVAVAAMWAITAGDAAAALVGRAFERRGEVQERGGRSPVATRAERAEDGESMGANGAKRAGGKTVRGSAACFVVTLSGALLLARLTPVESVIAAALATVAERYGEPMDDNARIAVAMALGIALWRKAFS